MEPDKNKDFKPGEEKSHVSSSGSNEITESDESATEAAPVVNEDANQVPDNNGDSSNISDSLDTSAAIRTPDPLESNDLVNQGDSDKIEDSMKSSGSDDSGKSGESDKNSSADEASDNSSSGSHKTKKSNRCQVCRKKVGLTGFVCRCGGLFCSVHRYSDKHNCTFNYREMGADEIRKNNPVILSEKIHKI